MCFFFTHSWLDSLYLCCHCLRGRDHAVSLSVQHYDTLGNLSDSESSQFFTLWTSSLTRGRWPGSTNSHMPASAYTSQQALPSCFRPVCWLLPTFHWQSSAARRASSQHNSLTPSFSRLLPLSYTLNTISHIVWCCCKGFKKDSQRSQQPITC